MLRHCSTAAAALAASAACCASLTMQGSLFFSFYVSLCSYLTTPSTTAPLETCLACRRRCPSPTCKPQPTRRRPAGCPPALRAPPQPLRTALATTATSTLRSEWFRCMDPSWHGRCAAPIGQNMQFSSRGPACCLIFCVPLPNSQVGRGVARVCPDQLLRRLVSRFLPVSLAFLQSVTTAAAAPLPALPFSSVPPRCPFPSAAPTPARFPSSATPSLDPARWHSPSPRPAKSERTCPRTRTSAVEHAQQLYTCVLHAHYFLACTCS
jgi:hypothetical protein